MNKQDKRPNGSQETVITGTETIISGIDTNKQLARSIDKI